MDRMIPDDQPTYAVHLTKDEMLLILDALDLVMACAPISTHHVSMATDVSDRIMKALPPKEAK